MKFSGYKVKPVTAWILFGVIVVIGFIIVNNRINTTKPSYYRITQPFRVTDRVPGVSGPAVHGGTPIHITYRRCIDLQTKVDAIYTIQYSHLNALGQQLELSLPAGSGASIIPAGCQPLDPTKKLIVGAPTKTADGKDLPPGIWKIIFDVKLRIHGSPNSSVDDHILISEPFQVVP